MMDTKPMPGCLTETRRRIRATRMLPALLVIAMAPPAFAAAPRPLAEALPPGRPSCHARVFDAAEQAANPGRRVTAITLERTMGDSALERRWGALEQFDGT